MNAAWLILLAGGVGATIGYLVGRRGSTPVHRHAGSLTGAATPHLLPDPALEWLRRASGALGVWAVESSAPGLGEKTYQSLDPSWTVGDEQLEAIERRLASSAARDGDTAERLETGLLLTTSAGGAVVGALLPPDSAAARQEAVRGDLAALLDGVGRRPVLHDLSQVQEGLAIETVESVGMRLAYQVERIAGAEAYVAVAEGAGVRIIGVSGLADRRALGQTLPPDATLDAGRLGRRGRDHERRSAGRTGSRPPAASAGARGPAGAARRRHRRRGLAGA